MGGKTLRMKRIFSRGDGRAVVFPLDHGVTCGPITGIERIADTVRAGVRGGADAIVLHKGMLRCLEEVSGRVPGMIMHLSASTNMGPSVYRKVSVGCVEEALRLGADAVSVHLNLGDASEPEMLRDVGAVGQSCAAWQVPLLVMAYARGSMMSGQATGSDVAHAARVAAELGADVIKIPFPGDYDMVARITSGLPVPVVIAGGVAGEMGQILERIEKNLEAGAAGVAVGRNVFQRANPQEALKAICDVAHGGRTAAEAVEIFSAGTGT